MTNGGFFPERLHEAFCLRQVVRKVSFSCLVQSHFTKIFAPTSFESTTIIVNEMSYPLAGSVQGT